MGFFSKKVSFKRYGVWVSQQRVWPYLVFVTTEASLLVKKANEILSTTRNECRRQQALSTVVYPGGGGGGDGVFEHPPQRPPH